MCQVFGLCVGHHESSDITFESLNYLGHYIMSFFFLHTSSLTLTLAAGSQCSYSLLVNELKFFTSIQMCVGEAK